MTYCLLLEFNIPASFPHSLHPAFPFITSLCSNIFIIACSSVKAYFLVAFIWFSFASVYFLASQSLLPDYQRLLSAMPSRRLNTAKLIENCGELLKLNCIWYFWRNSSPSRYCTMCLINCYNTLSGFFSFSDLILCNSVYLDMIHQLCDF